MSVVALWWGVSDSAPWTARVPSQAVETEETAGTGADRRHSTICSAGFLIGRRNQREQEACCLNVPPNPQKQRRPVRSFWPKVRIMGHMTHPGPININNYNITQL